MPNVHSDMVCTCPQDRSICRVIWRIGGNLPAANFIRLPQLHGSSLNLTGHILYLQVRCLCSPAVSFMDWCSNAIQTAVGVTSQRYWPGASILDLYSPLR
jgi:hypothetical protein